MGEDDKQVTPQQLGALGVGISVTIGSSLLTSLITPIPFPFNFLISFALGSTAGYGALKVLDPRTMHDIFEAQTNVRYKQMLKEIASIAVRTGDASQSLSLPSPEMSLRLGAIARLTEMILGRYQERRRDFAGTSATLLILQRFDEVLAHYLKVKRGEMFLYEDQIEKEILETETLVIPMFETALDRLGKKLDAGEAIDKGVSKGTLEGMLRSLDLIESLNDQIDSSFERRDSR